MLYELKKIDEIPGSESFVQELEKKYGTNAIQFLNDSGLKLNVGINDSEYKKTTLKWAYNNKAKNNREMDIFILRSESSSAPIRGYIFKKGEVLCFKKGEITQYFNITPEKKIGLEIIVK